MVEKKGIKKHGWTKRVFKWFFIILLVLLLIAAFFFHAPWKVIALLLIILAACTVLPKPARKWFWLSVAAIVLVLIIWVFLPEDNEGWRPYKFDEELAALQAKYAIPDSQNAAKIYNELLESYDANVFEPNFMDDDLDSLTRREPWLSKDHPELAKWLQDHQDTITTLIEASQIEDCRFPIVANTIDMSKQIDRLSSMRHWSFLIIRAGNNDIGDGRNNAALEKYMAVLRMAEHRYQQSAMIDIINGIAIESLAIRQFKRILVTNDPTEEHISIIEKALGEIQRQWNSDIPKILECEKLMNKNMWAVFYEVNPEGKVRFSRDPLAAMRSEFPEELPPLTYWQRKLTKAGTVLGWFFMPSMPQKVGEIIDGSYGDLFAMIEPDFDWQREPPERLSFLTPWDFTRIRFNVGFWAKLIVSLSKESYYMIHDLYVRNIAEQRGTGVIIALRRYKNKTGQWPETLDDIKNLVPAEIFVDPINGGSFVYKLTEENFTLYSKGKNKIDENGQYNSIWDPNSFVHRIEEDDRLIWPRKTCKTKNENADTEQSNTQKDEVK